MSQSETSTTARPLPTNQLHLWRADSERHASALKRDEHGVPRAAPHQFVLRDAFLRALLLFDQPPVAGHKLQPWPEGKVLPAAFLTWFVQRALNFARLPFCEDRLFSFAITDHDKQVVRDLLGELSPTRVEVIVREVAALYAHTQAQLKEKGLTHVRLRRGVTSRTPPQFSHPLVQPERGQAGQVSLLKSAAAALGHRHVRFEMDTLNSWSDDTGYEHHLVQLHALIPIEDVLYCTELLFERGDKAEQGEWVVINRAANGVVVFDIADIERGSGVDARGTDARAQQWDPNVVWDQHQPLVLRNASTILHRPDLRPDLLIKAPPARKEASLVERLLQVFRR